MSETYLDDDPDHTDSWLVDASRRLSEPDADVGRLISSITGNLERVRRPARRLNTDSTGIEVSDRVIRQLLATRIRQRLGRLVVQVTLDGDDAQLARVRIGLIARYHDDLVGDSDRVRDVADEVLTATLGPRSSDVARRSIDVRWQDLYTREWLS